MNRLSTGQKSSMDDGAGVGISERMRAQARGTAMARQNVENSISALQTADSWMQRVNDMLSRMSELSIEAQDGTMSTQDKTNINAEFQALGAEIKQITDGRAKFNGTNLLDGFSKVTQVGADSGQTITVSVDSLSAFAGTISGLDVSNTAGVAMTTIASAIDVVAKARAAAGGLQSRLDHTRAGLLTYEDNIRAAESKIRDIDMARESSEMMKQNILSQVGTSILAQANQQTQSVLKLVG
jgi:flagellin